jgi:hypothetical protein
MKIENVKKDKVVRSEEFNVIMVGGEKNVEESVSVRMRNNVKIKVENEGVIGDGEGSYVVRNVKIRIMGKNVMRSEGERMVENVIKYMESVVEKRDGWGIYVRIDVMKERMEKNDSKSVDVKMGENEIINRESDNEIKVGKEMCVKKGVNMEIGVRDVK